MKLVADTNTLISGSLWPGPSAQVLSAILQGKAELFLTSAILDEFQETLGRPKFAARLAAQNETPESLARRFRAACREIVPAEIKIPAELRDRDDVHILACAVAAAADVIVTGDKDLLTLTNFHGILIITAREALQRLSLPEER